MSWPRASYIETLASPDREPLPSTRSINEDRTANNLFKRITSNRLRILKPAACSRSSDTCKLASGAPLLRNCQSLFPILMSAPTKRSSACVSPGGLWISGSRTDRPSIVIDTMNRPIIPIKTRILTFRFTLQISEKSTPTHIISKRTVPISVASNNLRVRGST